MFLWLNNETAIYIKIEEGITLCLREIIEILKHINIDFTDLLERTDLMLNEEGAEIIFQKDYMPISSNMRVFEESDTFNLQYLIGDRY